MLDDPRGAGEPSGRLACLHRHRCHGADAGALHAVETGDGARRHVDPAAIGLGQRHPVGPAQQSATREHYEIAAGAQHFGRDLREMRLRRRLHDQIARRDEILERQEGRR